MRTLKLLSHVGILSLCFGCSSLFSVSAIPIKVYQIPEIAEKQLVELKPGALSQKSSRQFSLSIREPRASLIINSHKILFSPNNVEQGHYQFANWAEPPTERLGTLLVQTLSQADAFRAVSHLGNSVLADFQVNTEMLEFYHDVSSSESNYGFAKIKVHAELMNVNNRKVLAQKVFQCNVPVLSFDAKGAVDALTNAMHNCISELSSWVLSEVE